MAALLPHRTTPRRIIPPGRCCLSCGAVRGGRCGHTEHRCRSGAAARDAGAGLFAGQAAAAGASRVSCGCAAEAVQSRSGTRAGGASVSARRASWTAGVARRAEERRLLVMRL